MAETKRIEAISRMIFPNRTGGQMSGQMSNSIGGSINNSIILTDRQRDVLDLIRKDNRISYRKMAEVLDIADSAVKKHLNALKEKGIIKREGGTRGWWEVVT